MSSVLCTQSTGESTTCEREFNKITKRRNDHMKENPAVTPEKTVNTWQAVVLLVVSILGIVVGKVILGGNITIVLIIDAAIVAALSLIWGIKWSEIEEQMKKYRFAIRLTADGGEVYEGPQALRKFDEGIRPLAKRAAEHPIDWTKTEL